VFGRFDMISDP